MRTTKLLTAMAAGAAIMLAGCNVNDPIYETAHPDHGKITLTTDWSATNIATPPPAGYTVAVGGYSATFTGATNMIDNLFDPGDYTIYVHNTADGIAVSGTTATVAADGNNIVSLPDWLYTGVQAVTVEKDTDHEFTVAMAQQVRELTLVIEPTGGTINRIAGITGTLSGVAGSLDFASGTHATPSTVALRFAKGADGNWTVTVRLLGITGTGQKFTGTITYTEGSPGDQPLESDLNTALTDFNADKKTPLTLDAQLVETPTETGFTATITGWKPVQGDSVIAD